MTKTADKDKDKIQVVKIDAVDAETEAVYLYCDEPYVNEVKYAKRGAYKIGPLPDSTTEKKEE